MRRVRRVVECVESSLDAALPLIGGGERSHGLTSDAARAHAHLAVHRLGGLEDGRLGVALDVLLLLDLRTKHGNKIYTVGSMMCSQMSV